MIFTKNETGAFSTVRTAEVLDEIIGKPPDLVWMKNVPFLDEGCRQILAASSIAGFGYKDVDSHACTTFVGGRNGFAEIESAKTFAFDLADSDPSPQIGGGASFVFLIKGTGETLRLNGQVSKLQGTRVMIEMKEAYIHCARAVLRANLWRTKQMFAVAERYNSESDNSVENLKNSQISNFINQIPFLVLSSWNSEGFGDTSPRGDSPGFLRILDSHRLFMPDRRGNQRADTFHNLMTADEVSLAAMVPGTGDVLHIRARAQMTDDPRLLVDSALTKEVPKAGTIFRVESAAIVPNKALAKSRIWERSNNSSAVSKLDLNAIAMKHVLLNEQGGKLPTVVKIMLNFVAGSTRLTKIFGLINKRSLKSEGYADDSKPETNSPRKDYSVKYVPTLTLTKFVARMPNSFRLILKKSAIDLSAYFDNLAKKIEAYPADDTSLIPQREKHLQVAEVIKETENTVSISFEDPQGNSFYFKPGQYFTLALEIDGNKIRRSYSASSTPGKKRLTLTIKRVANGLCSNYINDHVKTGDFIEVLGPSGSFFIEPDPKLSREIVLISGGSGITPMMSIAKTVLESEPLSSLNMIYGNRSESEIIFKDNLYALTTSFPERFKVRHILENAPPNWTGGRGVLEPVVMERELKAISISKDAYFFICGPAPLMASARETLLKMNVAADRIHEERFAPASTVSAPADANLAQEPQSLLVMNGEKQIANLSVEPGRKILDAALDADVLMPFSCGMGDCGECKVKLIKGEVEMSQPNRLSEEDRANGYILTCVSKPKSSVEINIADQGELKINNN